MLAAPLMVGQRPLGVLAVGRSADGPVSRKPTSRWSRSSAAGSASGWPTPHASPATTASPRPSSAPSCPTRCPTSPGWTSRCATCPAPTGSTSAVTGTTRSRWAAAGSGWSSATWSGTTSLGVDHGPDAQPAPGLRDRPAAPRLTCWSAPTPALARLLPEALATAVYAVLDPATGELAYANAGHPPPVCATAPASIGYLDDAPASCSAPRSDGGFARRATRRLAAGASLMFYTDGLIEDRRRDITEGFGALADAMARPTGSARSGPAPRSSARSSARPRGRTTSACSPSGSPADQRPAPGLPGRGLGYSRVRPGGGAGWAGRAGTTRRGRPRRRRCPSCRPRRWRRGR